MIRASSSPPGRRQRNRERKLAAYLDHALAIAIEGGVDALTMPGLAERADTGVGSLYRYFSGKDAVIAALQVRAVSEYADHLEAAVGDLSGIEAIRAVSRSWAGFRVLRPELYALADQSLSDPRRLLDDERAAEVGAALAPALALAARAIDQAVAAGTLAPGDAAVRTHALWAAIHGAEHFRKRETRTGIGADAIRDELVGALIASWGRGP